MNPSLALAAPGQNSKATAQSTWTFRKWLLLMLILPAAATVASAAPAPISFGGGKLRYQPDRNGDMIPDFSYCGYMAGEKPIPDAP
ncbi:MAG: hypothetical protein OSB55_15570, partial [Verrucomicrobiota bacterium]|nr:hypothetical protein [Verrucomicrobiota bacterium]